MEHALLPDVVAVIAALFALDWRCDVALLVRMVLPLENPEPIKAAKVRSTVDGEVVFDEKTSFLTFQRDFSPWMGPTDGWPLVNVNPGVRLKLLKFLCHGKEEEPPGFFLFAVGVMPRTALPTLRFHNALALAVAGDFIDIYEILIARYKSEHNSIQQHIGAVLHSLPTRSQTFRYFQILLREFPDDVKELVLQQRIEVRDADWAAEWSKLLFQLRFEDDAITHCCKWGDAAHVSIFRFLFGRIPQLEVFAQDVYFAFTNPAAGDVITGNDLGLLRLLCEELRHRANLAEALSRDFFAWIVDRLNDFRETSLEPSRISRQQFKSRILYITKHFSLTPSEETLSTLLAYDRELHDELHASVLPRVAPKRKHTL